MKKIAIILAGVLSLLAIMVFLDEREYKRPLQEQIENKLEPLALEVVTNRVNLLEKFIHAKCLLIAGETSFARVCIDFRSCSKEVSS